MAQAKKAPIKDFAPKFSKPTKASGGKAKAPTKTSATKTTKKAKKVVKEKEPTESKGKGRVF